MTNRQRESFCVRGRKSGETATAAIAEVLRRHGVDIGADEVGERAPPSPRMELPYLLLAASKCGLDAVPLEGEFADLPEVVLPSVVILRGVGEALDFMVLIAVDSESATVADTLRGEVRRFPRESFGERWTGDVIQITVEEAALATLRAELVALRDPWVRRGRRVGVLPFTRGKLGFIIGVVAAGLCVAGPGPADWALRAAVALAAVLSLWLGLFADGCRSCSRAARLVGSLPLASVGAAAYGVTLAALVVLPAEYMRYSVYFLAAAAGAHLHLLMLMLRSGQRCLPCLCVAAAVMRAAVTAMMAFGGSAVGASIALLSGLVVTRWLTAAARRLDELELAEGAMRLALRTLDEPLALTAGQALLVVYKREGCFSCVFYETAVRRALAQEFGAGLIVEERALGPADNVGAPLFVIRGSADFLVEGFGSDDMHERLDAVIRLALEPRLRGLRECGGVHVIRPRAPSDGRAGAAVGPSLA